MADISNVVNVQTSIVGGGVQARDFGIVLFVTNDSTMPADNSLQIFASIEDVAAVFSTSSIPYQAASVYFAQSPTPANLMIGRWFVDGVPAQLKGGTLPPLSELTAITNGAFTFNSVEINGLDFSSATSYQAITAIIEDALTTAAPPQNVTITFNVANTNFIVTNNPIGPTPTMSYFSAPTSGTDISDLLKLSETTAVDLSQGQTAESIEEAMERFESINDIFYMVTLDPTYNDTTTVSDLAAWIEDRIYLYIAESLDSRVLNTDESDTVFSSLFAAQYLRVSGDWNSTLQSAEGLYTKFLSVSTAARMSSSARQLGDGANVLINPNLKERPLISSAKITTTQSNELDRKRVNRFVPFGGNTTSPTITTRYRVGYVFKDNITQDVVVGTDWWANAIQLAVFNLLINSDVIAQTNTGMTQIVSVISNVCTQAVRNGLLAPGQLSDSVKNQVIAVNGNSDFNGFLPQGYLIYAEPIGVLTEQERVDRLASPIYVWGKSAGAINRVDISLVFNQ